MQRCLTMLVAAGLAARLALSCSRSSNGRLCESSMFRSTPGPSSSGRAMLRPLSLARLRPFGHFIASPWMNSTL
jgi:hypothetical protein